VNTKRTIPLIVALLPLLLIVGAVFLVVKWIFSGKKNTETIPETTPANTETENRRKEAETPAFRHIPAEIPAKPSNALIISAPAPVFPPSVPPVANAPASVVTDPVIKTVAQTAPPPIKKKFVTRGDLATVFHRGVRPLTRTAAVAALKRLGFGKSAAYDALLEDGRFSAWLRFTPDGIITWTE
jgi:hypothetical protein